jgi:hypothetical protein
LKRTRFMTSAWPGSEFRCAQRGYGRTPRLLVPRETICANAQRRIHDITAVAEDDVSGDGGDHPTLLQGVSVAPQIVGAAAVRAVSGLHRAGADRALARPGAWGARDRTPAGPGAVDDLAGVAPQCRHARQELLAAPAGMSAPSLQDGIRLLASSWPSKHSSPPRSGGRLSRAWLESRSPSTKPEHVHTSASWTLLYFGIVDASFRPSDGVSTKPGHL